MSNTSKISPIFQKFSGQMLMGSLKANYEFTQTSASWINATELIWIRKMRPKWIKISTQVTLRLSTECKASC